MENLAASEFGLDRNKSSTPTAQDSFEITTNISELLSPACGMTDEEKESYLTKIMAKLKSGKRLGAEEMRFLQAENPVLYQQAARVQAMRESLRARLAVCSSKEEVDNTYASAMSLVCDDDPMKEYIVAAYDDVLREFKKSDDYQKLPEKNKEKGAP